MEYKLCDICDFQGGSQPPKEEWSFETQDGYLRMLQIRDFTQGEKVKPEYIKISASTKQCKEDDVLIARYGASLGKILTGLAGAYNVAIMKTIPDISKIRKKYLYYYLKAPYFQNSILNVGSRAAQAGFNKEDLMKLVIECPDLARQDEIINILSKMELIIEEEKQQIKKFDSLIKSRFVEMFGDPILNIMGWPVPLIEEVVSSEKNALKAGPFGSALKKEFYVKSGYKIYGQEQVINEDPTYGDYYIDEEKYKSLENCAVKAGDVLISLVGTYGKLLIMPEVFEAGIINPRLMKITFDRKRVNPVYFKYYFQSDSLKQALSENTHGGTMDILNLGIVRKLQMPLPPLELQNQFAAFVHQIDKLKFD